MPTDKLQVDVGIGCVSCPNGSGNVLVAIVFTTGTRDIGTVAVQIRQTADKLITVRL